MPDTSEPLADEPTLLLSSQESSGPRTFADGEVVGGRYEIVRFVAAGGMGEVYEAMDRELREHVAIKTVRALGVGSSAIERLRREIQLARRVTHPNVCRTFDIGRHRTPHGEVTFVTMELLRGTTLGRFLRQRGRLTPDEAFPIVRQIADGLAAAHRAGIVHRDLKSDNIMLVQHGEATRAVITDFGLARLAAAEDDAVDSLTRPGDVIGTAAYLAPEQCEGSEPTPACDIYAFGVVMYEMVTGRRPFPGASLVTTVIRKLREPATSPRLHVPDLDPRWEAAILRCLQRDPEERFADATDVIGALSGPMPQPRARGRAILLTGAALGIFAVAASILQYRESRKEPPAPQLRQTFSPRRSVAIIGFRNASGRPEAAWLSTALSEMLATELAAEGRLRAISGEEVQRAKIELALGESGSFAAETLQRIHRNIGADLVVTGAYVALSSRDDAIRIDVRLQDPTAKQPDIAIAESGRTDDLFHLVTRIGGKMRAAIGVGPVSVAASTQALGSMPSDPGVARLYAEGLSRLRTFDALGARNVLERAAARDPKQPLVHAALASAWAALGYDREARESARTAFELSDALPREQKMLIEAGHRESVGEWDKAVEIYRVLASFFSDNVEYGLELAAAQTRKGTPADALATLASLRSLPEPIGSDPRIDLAEADAAGVMGDYRRMELAARRAIMKGEARGARLLVARGLSAAGVALHRQGKTKEGIEVQQRALAIYRQAGDRGGIARALIRIGSVLIYRGESGAAQPYFEDARKIGDETGDTWVKAAALNNLGFSAFTRGEPHRAEELLREMLDLAQRLGDRRIEAVSLDNLGYARMLQGNLDDATEYFTRSVDMARGIRSQQLLAVATTNVGDVLLARGDVDGARMQYEAALTIRQKIGEKRAVQESQLALARIAIEEENGEDAERLARGAVEWAHGSGVWDVESLARAALSHALLLQKRVPEAQKEAAEALRLADTHDNVLVQITANIARARVASTAGEKAQARQFAERAVQLAKRGPLYSHRLEAERMLAEVTASSRLLEDVKRRARARGFLLLAG